MQNDKIKRLKELSPTELEAHGFLSRSPDGNFICPHCFNGNHGISGTGIQFVFQDGIYKAHCFGCGMNFDNIRIFAEVFHLNEKADFKEIITRASHTFFGNGADTMHNSTQADSVNHQPNSTHADGVKNAKQKKRLDCTALYTLAQNNLPDFLNDNGGSFRGLPQHILNHAGVGFLPPQDYKKISKDILPTPITYRYPAIIIPCSKTSYQARFLVPNVNPKYSCYKDMEKDIFLLDDLSQVKDGEIVFLVEGYIDAMSILAAGHKAIAIAGQSLTAHYQDQLKTVKTKPRFVVALDRDVLKDPAKAKNPDKIVEILNQLGFDATKNFFPDFAKKPDGNTVPIKDANDFLQVNADDFKMYVEFMVTEAEEFFAHKDDKQADDDGDEDFEEKTSFSSAPKSTAQFLTDCPVDLFIPEEFAMGPDGSLWKRFKDPERLPELMLEMPLLISARRTDDNYSGAQYDICWRKFRKKKWRTIKAVPAEYISDSRALAKVLSQNSIQVDSKTANRLSTYFARLINLPENDGRIPEKVYYKKTGWNKDFTQFIYPTGDDGDCPIQNGNFGFDTAFESKGDAEKQADLLVATLLEGSAARNAVSAFALAPAMRPIFGNAVQNFLVHLYGPSGNGKTAACMIGAAIFGNPAELKGTFASTPKYSITRAHKFNDFPCYTDELQALPISRRDHYDNMLYTLEAGKEYGRLNKDAEGKDVSRSYYTHISTGEQPITTLKANQGAINRVLQIDSKGICSPFLATQIYEQSAENYGNLGRPIIKWLQNIDNRRKLKDFYFTTRDKLRYKAACKNGYSKDFATFRREGAPLEVIGLIDRHVTTQAALMMSLYMLTEVIADMFQTKYNNLHRTIASIIDDDIDEFVANASHSEMTTNAARALPIVAETAFSDPDRFGGENAKGEVYAGSKGPQLGFKMQNGEIYFFANQLRTLIKDVGFNSDDDIIDGFNELGVLKTDNSQKHRYQKSVTLHYSNGRTQRLWMYVFKANAEELVEENKRRLIEKLVA